LNLKEKNRTAHSQAARLSHSDRRKTRGFPSPSYGGFGFFYNLPGSRFPEICQEIYKEFWANATESDKEQQMGAVYHHPERK
jgi:hypothetical protein